MAKLDKSFETGLHTEQLSGRTQQVFFSPEEGKTISIPTMPMRLISIKKLNLMQKIWKYRKSI